MTTGKILREVVERELRDDPGFRKEWERTRIAREVAIRVVEYRANHKLTQQELAAKLGVKQPVVARLEGGEYLPSVLMLRRLADSLGMEFHIRDQEFRVLSPDEVMTPPL
jgi:ribosome-binding protein aMBF1 (putative translation factor)